MEPRDGDDLQFAIGLISKSLRFRELLQQPRNRADVPAIVRGANLSKWLAEFARPGSYAEARHAVDEDRFADDVLEEMCEDVLLNDVIGIDVLADFRIYFVPRSPGVRVDSTPPRR